MAEQQTILVVNADDFGLSVGINQGIKSAFHNGILRSTSIMANGTAFDDAVLVSSATPGLGVGIHVSLVDEHCVAPAHLLGKLVDSTGQLPTSYKEFAKSFMLRRFGLKEVATEIEAQIAKVLAAGIKPTHIDSHQHLHIFPGIIDVVISAAQDAGIKTIRIPLDEGGIGTRGIQQKILARLCKQAAAKSARAGLKVAHHFRGFGISGHMTEENLLKTIETLRPGINELMCHPGFADAATERRYQWGYEWNSEAAGLISEKVLELVHSKGIKLASFEIDT